ncbi:hypothetical protein MSM1_04805 [Mycobacterium sp. SM1]|uniref:hypothetical protein n=1 Tax=Mycobacterium sp. SM1 TaxID=2816243 RepID=UPI001BCAAA02|nr:hypothetical protein [Mycobacterium sp. SM1]MBS4727694.1 hypothetical protein [Mycobacterium sp. SM1]
MVASAAPGSAGLAIAIGLHGGDPLRPAPPGWRSPSGCMVATAAPGSAGLAIAIGLHGGDPLRPAPPGWRSPSGCMVATRCARLRRAGDRHER